VSAQLVVHFTSVVASEQITDHFLLLGRLDVACAVLYSFKSSCSDITYQHQGGNSLCVPPCEGDKCKKVIVADFSFTTENISGLI